MRKKPALYILNVTFPNTTRPLVLNILDRVQAAEAARDLIRDGCKVEWEAHGYTVYRTSTEALAEARSHARYLDVLKQSIDAGSKPNQENDMHIVEAYKQAVVEANRETLDKFGVRGPYDPDTEPHTFWLEAMDRHYTRLLGL
jgi:hypothetical protein